MSKSFLGLLVVALSSAWVGAVDKMRHMAQVGGACDDGNCDAGDEASRLGMRHTATASEALKAVQVSYDGRASNVEASAPADRMHASSDGGGWGRRRRATPAPTPPPAARATRSGRDGIVHEEIDAIKAVEMCASAVTNAMANSNDVKSIRSTVEQCRRAARQAKKAGHDAIKANVGAMSDEEKMEVRRAVDHIKRQTQRGSLASDEGRYHRRRRAASQEQRDVAMKEESAGKNLELQAAILSKALEENRAGKPSRSLLAQPEGEGIVEPGESTGGAGEGEGDDEEGSEDPGLFTNIDEIVDSFLDAAENALNKALDAAEMGVGPLRDMLGNVFQGIRGMVDNVIGKAGDFLANLFGGLR